MGYESSRSRLTKAIFMTPIYERPIDILRTLIRFDTTNPPGNEKACIGYVSELLESAGIPTTLLAKTPSRPNLIARLPGAAKHLLFCGRGMSMWSRP